MPLRGNSPPVPAENTLTCAPWAHTPVRRLVVGEVEGKAVKRRQRRMKRTAFEAAARLAARTEPGIGMPQRCKPMVSPRPLPLRKKDSAAMLGGRKTVICEFLGTGMISVMPVPLLSVHPRECSPQGHIRYVPSVCVYRWTCPVPPHKPPLQAL